MYILYDVLETVNMLWNFLHPLIHGTCADARCPLCRSDEDLEDMAQRGVKNAAFTVLDVSKIPAKEGQPKCPRCSGAVFQAESMPCRGRVSTERQGCPFLPTLLLHFLPRSTHKQKDLASSFFNQSII